MDCCLSPFAVFRRFVDNKLQLAHFRGGFGVTPNAGSAISAFYAASVSLMQWLGFCSHQTLPAHGPQAKI